MIKTPIRLQDLRRRIYVKAKAEPTWRFWVLYVHVCKMETLQEAYQIAKSNKGAPGIDGVTFEAIEESGVESFLKQIQHELAHNTYRPMPVRKKEIPKDGGTKVRVLSIPAIRDRVVQGALKHILEPIFDADFQSGSYGYRPKRSAHAAVDRVAQAIVQGLTRVIDLDLRAYFDNVQHSLLLEKVARRVQDTAVRLLKMILKSTGEKGVPQGGVISPMLSNLYLTEVDRMLEKAIATTQRGKYPNVQYARFADDLVVLIDSHSRHEWLMGAVEKRLREEITKLRVEINEEKSRKVDLSKGGSFSFLGFEYRRIRSCKRMWRAQYVPKLKKRTALLQKLKEIFQRYVSQPVGRVIELLNPILRGWVHYFAVGDSSRCFPTLSSGWKRRFDGISCVQGSAQDSAGSGGVSNGSTTHSDYLPSTGSLEPSAESPPERIGHITLDVKHTGKPSAGNLHAGFDEAGAGDQGTMRLVRHSPRKREAPDQLHLRRLGASPRPY